jgi:phosphotransacetylase
MREKRTKSAKGEEKKILKHAKESLTKKIKIKIIVKKNCNLR